MKQEKEEIITNKVYISDYLKVCFWGSFFVTGGDQLYIYVCW